MQESINCKLRYPRRMKFVFTCSRLQHDGRKQLLAVTTPCSGTQTYLYTIYLVIYTCRETNTLQYYRKLHCAFFLFDIFLRHSEGECSGDRRGGKTRARVRCSTVRGGKSWQISYRRLAKRMSQEEIVRFVLIACSRDAIYLLLVWHSLLALSTLR